jgi:hypothetical protein
MVITHRAGATSVPTVVLMSCATIIERPEAQLGLEILDGQQPSGDSLILWMPREVEHVIETAK